MTDKDLLYQVLNREITNLLSRFGGSFRLLSPMITNYVTTFIAPYVDAFTSMDDGTLNTKAAGSFLKEEVSTRIDDFMKRFEAEQKNDSGKA